MEAPRMLQHYRLLARLGSGGMGEVWAALDTRLDRRVAIKLLPPGTADDPASRRRFSRESRALAALDHHHVVTVHAVESEGDGPPFLVMELVEGVTLRELVPPAGLPPERCLELLIPVADAMAAAHRAGIMHRDLKPDNVMVRHDGVVKVVDFGLSKREPVTLAGGRSGQESEALTQEGYVVGTVHYLPPEHLEGRPVGPAGDVFSLGVLLYEVVTGERPFLGSSPLSVVGAILRGQPRLLAPEHGRIPGPLAAVITRCLAKDPAGRYADAGELLAALRAIDLGSTAAPMAPAGHALRSWPRTAMRRLLVAALPVALVAATVALWVLRGERVAVPGFVAPAGAPAAATVVEPRLSAPRPTVAVLPMRELSGDSERRYFAEGTTEALTASLARIGALRVISQGSASSAAPEGRPLREIAAALGADYLVRGSVARDDAGATVLIVQLVDPDSGETLWGDTRQGRLSEVLGFQAEVAREVARAVRAPVSAAEATRLADSVATDEASYDLYLRGRYELARRTPESIQRALSLFQQVASVDPGFAPAHVGIAEASHMLGSVGYAVEPTVETVPRAERAARRALELAPESPEAWSALAMNRLLAFQWEEAEAAFQQALVRNPSNAMARHYFSMLLTARGRHREALAQIERARALDPLSRPVAQAEAAALFFAGDYQGALAAAERSLERHPDHWFFHLVAGDALSLLRRHDEAQEALQRALDRGQRNPLVLAAVGIDAQRRGDRQAAGTAYDELARRRRVGYVSPVLLAKLAYALDDAPAARRWLDEALAERDFALAFVEVDPDFAPAADDPHLRAVAQRVAAGG